MLAMGRLAQDMLGTGTSVGGAACTPGTGLTVVIAPGGIYSLQNIDNTAYGSLPADTAHQTIKQGTLFNAVTLSCPAPPTAGQSINYLIEGQYQEADTNAAIVPYYNSANPIQPFLGPNNSGSAQNTLRQGLFVVQAKAGVAAATGSQATPAADAGWVGMYVVTVDNGEASLASADIVLATPSPFIGVTALNALSKAVADTLYSPIGALTQAIADLRYAQLTARTSAETTASVVPTNLNFQELDPRRYGALGNGSDDTAALNSWVAVVNASTNPVSNWPAGLTFMSAPLNAITANNFTWHCNSTLLVKPNSWGTGPTSHVQVNGTGARVYGLRVNGNMSAWSSAIAGFLLQIGGSDFLLDSVQLTNSQSEGLMIDTVTKGRFINCHFDSNGFTGADFRACSYFKFTNCTFNFNGYGFQKTLATNAFQGFAVAQRYRCHHMTYVNCEALQNGRDGFNCNQGTYAVKFIATLAWNNGDGGFTIAADGQGTGRPGDSAAGITGAGTGESCYDLEYIDCEAENNWSSGLVAYAPAFNVTVDGGRYYNNNNVAGTLTAQSSFANGIFFAGGSLGIRVRTKAYDDRQMCPVTSTSGTGPFTVNVTGWVPGSGVLNPRVAIYNASLQFSGYGNIVSESAGQVVITPSLTNAFAGTIPAGYFVSQRVQHNGCFYDNNCTGTQDIDGFGFLPGVFSFSGFKSLSGFTAGGQNVLLPAATIDTTELLANPTFDAGINNWAFNLPGGGASNFFTTAGPNIRSPGALQLVGGTTAATADSALVANGLNYAQGAWVEASIWCNAVNAGDASIALQWNPSSGALATVLNHPGGGWKQLKIGGFIPAGATSLNIRLTSAIGKTNYFDNGSMRVKSDSYDNRDFAYPTRNLAA